MIKILKVDETKKSQYGSQKKWLLLSVTTDIRKKKYCMAEDDFTGVLFLEENGNFFNGN